MQWITRRQFNKVAKVIGIIALILATTMGIFTFFGANGGNFVVNFKPSNGINIAIYDNEAMNNPLTRLSYQSILDQNNITYTDIPDNIEEGLGCKNETVQRSYTALSFILKNESTVSVDLQMVINMSKIVQKVDSAIRVMYILDGERKVFAKPQEIGDNIGMPEVDVIDKKTGEAITTIPFLSPVKVCEYQYMRVEPGAMMKMTIIIWLEGNDPQCIDNIRGGSMKMSMDMWVI